MKGLIERNKRFMSIVLVFAIILLVAAVPVTANAAGEEGYIALSQQEAKPGSYVRSGDYEYFIKFDNTIDIYAYYGSEEYITIPESIDGYRVTSIGSTNNILWYWTAYNHGASIKGIIVNGNVDCYSFGDAGLDSLEYINVNNNDTYTSIDGVLFDKDLTTIFLYPASKADKKYIVPSSVTTILTFGFNNNPYIEELIFTGRYESFWLLDPCSDMPNLKTATYPIMSAEYSYYYNGAFKNCPNLATVYISREVMYMGEDDFMNSPNVVLYVYRDSYAHQWAIDHKMPFRLIDDITDPTETQPTETVPNTDPPETQPTETVPNTDPTETQPDTEEILPQPTADPELYPTETLPDTSSDTEDNTEHNTGNVQNTDPIEDETQDTTAAPAPDKSDNDNNGNNGDNANTGNNDLNNSNAGGSGGSSSAGSTASATGNQGKSAGVVNTGDNYFVFTLALIAIISSSFLFIKNRKRKSVRLRYK